MLIKPKKLKAGDTVAIVSLSSGLAGEENILWRTQQGIKRLEEVFGLKVKVMPHALKGLDYIDQHREKRAADLNQAIADPEVKAIVSTIGGNDTGRILPFIDIENLKAHPKIFSGYSDTTTNHLYFYRHGISTSYGPALLTDFAENIAMDPYTVDHIKKTWFNSDPIGEVLPSPYIREHGLRWDEENQKIERPKVENSGYEIINGHGKVQGHLLGGCLEVLSKLQSTEYFPNLNDFTGAILFIETSERYTPPALLKENLRNFAQLGIFDKVKGVLVGKPQNNVYFEEYKKGWQQVLKEAGQEDLPVLYNASFGHNEPKCILPYGVQAELDVDNTRFSILESAVID